MSEQSKKKLCPCRILAIGLAVIMLVTFLSAGCTVLNLLWWHSVTAILWAVALQVLVVYGAIIYIGIKGVELKQHHSDCTFGR